ncbi:unnamed protein product [Schistosoma spindalis]|nr:unnamed protein product [Schistosoma spindale]
MSRPPSNFSWVSKSVAGFAFPREKYELEYLVDNAGISHIITLCHEVPQYISDFTSVKHYHLPVEDLTSASLPVIQKAMEIIKQAETNNEVSSNLHLKRSLYYDMKSVYSPINILLYTIKIISSSDKFE